MLNSRQERISKFFLDCSLLRWRFSSLLGKSECSGHKSNLLFRRECRKAALGSTAAHRFLYYTSLALIHSTDFRKKSQPHQRETQAAMVLFFICSHDVQPIQTGCYLIESINIALMSKWSLAKECCSVLVILSITPIFSLRWFPSFVTASILGCCVLTPYQALQNTSSQNIWNN